MPIESIPEADKEPRSPVKGSRIGAAFALVVLVFSGGLVLGGEIGDIMLAGAEPLPMTALAVLAYLGIDRGWARILAILWLFGMVLGVGLLTLALSAETLSGAAASSPEAASQAGDGLSRLWIIVAGLFLGLLAGLVGFLPGVRRGLSRVLPIDPDSFVHAVALVAVITLTLISFVPLLVLAVPPLLAALPPPTEGDPATGSESYSLLRQDLYGLMWMIPAAVFAVGFGIQRNLRQSLLRLGLVRPTLRQVVAGLGLGVVMLVAAQLLGLGVESIWASMGWPQTDEEAFTQLIAYSLSPLGALVLGLTAGLGEELAVRGVLQPRLGILLSNLFFTGLHALQYNWDALVSVFLLGLVFGVIRQRANTSTSAIVHGSYDFLVTMVIVLQVPWFS